MDTLDMAGHLIRRLNQISTQVFTAHMQASGFDLTPVQFAAMDAIQAHPGSDQATIALLIAYDRATIGGVIDRLEQKALVQRTVSATDKRAREVKLTAKGAKTLAQLKPIVTSLQQEILGPLTSKERSTFLALARKAVALDTESAPLP